MKIRLKKIFGIRSFLWTSMILISLVIYTNQKIVAIYYNYAWYKVSHENNDALSHMYSIIASAREAGYSCKNKQIPGAYAYQEVLKRRVKTSLSRLYTIPDCIQLPTGEIILSLNDGIVRYCILLKADDKKPETHHILDIRGEAIG